MTDLEFTSSVTQWLSSLGNGEATVRVEEGNVIFTNWNDVLGVPVPDWIEEVVLD